MEAPRPLEGVKVVDLTTVLLGPVTTRLLADYGATVVKIESWRHMDALRTATPYRGEPGVNRSGYFAAYNAGKLSLTLDLQKPQGREFFKRYLLPWADVVIEAFAPGVAERWGLDYHSLLPLKPDLVMLRASLMGHSGPLAPLKGFGNFTAAMSGIHDLTGWPDRPPAGPYSAYSDFIAWNYCLIALLSALDYRRRTGKGQFIDQSLLESTAQFMAHAVLDYSAHGTLPTRSGNQDPHFAPHGVYPCRDLEADGEREERWVAICVTSDAQWRALCRVMGRPGLAEDPRYATAEGRLKHRGELDRLVGEWTRERDAAEVMHTLQAEGVPAGVVQNARDLLQDPQLAHRGHFHRVGHPEMGPHLVPTSSFRLLGVPHRPLRGAPLLGEHNDYVCRELLGIPPDELARWAETGIFE